MQVRRRHISNGKESALREQQPKLIQLHKASDTAHGNAADYLLRRTSRYITLLIV